MKIVAATDAAAAYVITNAVFPAVKKVVEIRRERQFRRIERNFPIAGAKLRELYNTHN